MLSASLQVCNCLVSTCHFFQENNVRAFLWSIWMLSGDCMLLYNMFFMLLNGDYLLGNRIDFAPTGSLVHFRHLGNIIYCIALLKIQLNFLLPGYHSSNTLCMRSISPVRPQAIKKSNCITVYQYRLICLNNQSMTMPYSSVICNPTLNDNLKAASEWISSSGFAMVERGLFSSLKQWNSKYRFSSVISLFVSAVTIVISIKHILHHLCRQKLYLKLCILLNTY